MLGWALDGALGGSCLAVLVVFVLGLVVLRLSRLSMLCGLLAGAGLGFDFLGVECAFGKEYFAENFDSCTFELLDRLETGFQYLCSSLITLRMSYLLLYHCLLCCFLFGLV